MDVNLNTVSSLQGADVKNDKNNEATDRVKKEFLRQLYGGKDGEAAFWEAIKAFDSKYQPPRDVFFSATRYHSIKTETVKSWLNIIEQAVPIISDTYNNITSLFNQQ